jgi:acetoin utilization deacetylase AcuC-like enzyme
MDVVWTDLHRRQNPKLEINLGQPIPTYERGERAETIRRELETDDRFRFVDLVEHGRAPIEAVHDHGLIDYLETAWPEMHRTTGRSEFAPEAMLHTGLRDGMSDARPPHGAAAAFGYWCYETATPMVEGTYVAARASVDVALTAADKVLAGASSAYGLCRPPGHHAARSVFGGFCYFNNAAVVAHHVASTTGTKVTVLDVDYHHGNGTQQIFYERDDVQFVSLHGNPNRAYPWFIGHEDEIGAGKGRGTNLNVVFEAEAEDDEYVDRLGIACASIAAFAPSMVIVSLGLDTYWNDPISDLALTTDGYRRCGEVVRQLGLPTVVLQEGGYDIEAIGRNVHAWLTPFV